MFKLGGLYSKGAYFRVSTVHTVTLVSAYLRARYTRKIITTMIIMAMRRMMINTRGMTMATVLLLLCNASPVGPSFVVVVSLPGVTIDCTKILNSSTFVCVCVCVCVMVVQCTYLVN